ncbi:MAG: TrkA family potassium uptake protein [Spirochaetes bacterium]|nr:TrkA family potassium uptake protein [Spirochaetota bacterium]
MKRYMIIGLGNFGISLARKMELNGCEVLGIDISRELVEINKDVISQAIIGDSTNKDLIDSITPSDFDGAVICIGQDIASSTLTALYLKESGLKNIIVRAITADHGKILTKIGITDVIYPEIEIAEKLANKLSMKNVLDYLPLSEEHGILEVISPISFIGKNLKQLNLSSRFHCQIIAIKYFPEDNDTHDLTEMISLILPPTAEDIIKKNSIMVIIGKLSDIKQIEKIH